jgi:hypothetical protein
MRVHLPVRPGPIAAVAVTIALAAAVALLAALLPD